MIELFYWPTPKGHKITLFLEEAGVLHRITRVDICIRARPATACACAQGDFYASPPEMSEEAHMILFGQGPPHP